MFGRDQRLLSSHLPSRRTFVKGLAIGGAAATVGMLRQPAWAQARQRQESVGAVGYRVRSSHWRDRGQLHRRAATALTVNGSLPGPPLHWREGDTVTLRVPTRSTRTRRSTGTASCCPPTWTACPASASTASIRARRTRYRFTVKQNGTYWYHSHSGFQEQQGVYGPLVIEPREPDPFRYDREHVVLLTDWTDEDPERVFTKLKKQSDYYNFRQRTLGDFVRDVRRTGARRDARRSARVGRRCA